MGVIVMVTERMSMFLIVKMVLTIMKTFKVLL